jgi:hypothetical protein
MNVFEMVIVIVIIGCATGIIKEYLKRRERSSSTSQENLDDALDRIDDLEERVRVLERVVTDDRYELNRQIDDLKDQ